MQRQSGTRVVASDIVQPTSGWPQNTAATGVGGTGTPTSWAGNIWPTTPTCQSGYLQTQAVDMAVNPDLPSAPNSRYELKDQIALRNSTRCGTGTGDLAGVTLTVSVPASIQKNNPVTPSGIVAGSANESSPITFFYWQQPTAPTDCTTGGTTVGTASTAGDGTYPSSLSYTPTTAGAKIWWYATLPADSNNISAVSACGPSMPVTSVTNGPSSPTLTMVAPSTASQGIAISPASIGATLAGSSGATTGSTITFYYKATNTQPVSGCGGAGWTSVGTASPTGDGTWHPAAGYTPTATTKLWWYASFSGDANDNPQTTTCGSGMASTTVGLPTPTLQITAPASGTASTLITAASITATLSSSIGSSAAAINVYVYGPNAIAPTTCTGAGWTQVGAAINSTGSGAYHPSVGYTPPAGGTYYWYATYAGDANNGPTATACGGSMTSTAVVGLDTFAFSAIGTKTAGVAFNVTLTANLWTGGTDTSYTGVKCLSFSGPAASPSGAVASYPAQAACGAGLSSVTFASGVATFSVTLFNAASTTLTATQGSVVGTSASFTVNAGSPTKFQFTHCSANGGAVTNPCAASISVGKSPGYATLHISVTDTWGNLATVTGSPITVTFSNTPAGKFTLTGTATIAVGASESSAVTATNQGNNNSAVIATTNAGFPAVSITVQR